VGQPRARRGTRPALERRARQDPPLLAADPRHSLAVANAHAQQRVRRPVGALVDFGEGHGPIAESESSLARNQLRSALADRADEHRGHSTAVSTCQIGLGINPIVTVQSAVTDGVTFPFIAAGGIVQGLWSLVTGAVPGGLLGPQGLTGPVGIADVVTGKFDVREAAARLPEQFDELEAADDTDVLIGDDEEIDDADIESSLVEAET